MRCQKTYVLTFIIFIILFLLLLRILNIWEKTQNLKSCWNQGDLFIKIDRSLFIPVSLNCSFIHCLVGSWKFAVLKKKKNCLFLYMYSKAMCCGVGQLGFQIYTKNENFVIDHSRTIRIPVGCSLFSNIRGKTFFFIS